MEIQRQSDAPKLNSPDGAVSLIHGRNLATGRRLSPLFDPYASDSSGSPSPLLKYLCSAGPKFVSSPSFMTPVKVEEDVIVMDGVPVKKSNKRSGEARMRSPLMSSSSFNSNRFGGSSDSTPSPSSAAAGIENVRPHSNRLRRRCWKTCRCGTCRFSSDRQLAHGKEELQLPPRYSGKIKFEIFESNNNLEGSASPSYGNNYSPISQVKSLSPSAAGGGEEALPLLSPPAAMVLSSPPAQAKPFSGTAVPNRTIPNAYPRRSYWSPQDDGIEVALPRSSTELSLLLKGTVVAPPDKFGETLQDERVNGGAFIGTDGLPFPQKLIPNAGMRLYGGAQYHRAMAEFRFVVGGTKCPPITREEIVNACGVEDIHDGTNYSRTACVIAVAKARDTFEPFLHQLGGRLLHILKRLLPISVFLLQKDGEYLSGHEVFLKRVSSAFNNFAESTERSCREKCMEDLMSTTRYVSWSLHNKNRAGLRQFLDSFAGSESSTVGVNPTSLSPELSSGFVGSDRQEVKSKADMKPNNLPPGSDSTAGSASTTETRLADLLDSTLWNRRLAPSSERIVYALVQQIFHGIREYFLASTELKFNCFLLMPVVDKLPALLREDLDSAFEDVDSVFDVTTMRHSLGQRKRETDIELKRIQRLKEKFRQIHGQLSSSQAISKA